MDNDIKSLNQLSNTILGKEPGRLEGVIVKLQCIKQEIYNTILRTPIIKDIIAGYGVLVQEDRKIAFTVSRDVVATNNMVSHVYDMIQTKELERLIHAHIEEHDLSAQECLQAYNELLEELKDFSLARLCPNTTNLTEQVKSQLAQKDQRFVVEDTRTLQNLIINYQQLIQAKSCIRRFFIKLKHANTSVAKQ